MNRWRVAAGTSIGLAVGWGPFFILSFGSYQKPLITEFGWSRASVSFGFSLATIVAVFLTTLIGALVDRYGVKRTTLASTLAFPLWLASLSLVHSYGGYLAWAAILGVIGPWTTYPAYLPILPRTFERNLGAALAVASAGIGLGTTIASFCTVVFILHLGWRTAIMAVSAMLLVIGTINALTMLPFHKHDKAVVKIPAHTSDGGLSFREAMSTGVFWKLSISFALVILVGIGVNFHMSALLTDRGFTPLQAAGVVSLIGVAILAARLATGIALDYVPLKILAPIIFLGQATASILLASGAHGAVPYVAACLIGGAIGGEGDLMPYAFSKQFGTQAFGKIYGTGFVFYNVGTLLGPLLLGEVYGVSHSYLPGLVGFACLSLIAAVLIAVSGNTQCSA